MQQVSPESSATSSADPTLLLLGQVIAKVDTVLELQRDSRADQKALDLRVTALEHWKTRAIATAAAWTTAVAVTAGGIWQLLSVSWKP
jgi:hypothetical protein